MNANWAAENLQTIRTLMERSALYRRALAPVTMLAGVVGLAAGGIGWMAQCDSPRSFICFWFSVACATLAGSFVVIRRQALRDKESFWSPPTRRVAQAMLPCLYLGLIAGMMVWLFGRNLWAFVWVLIPIWMALYGAALHAAGFFMPRGIKVLGWVFMLVGTLLFLGVLLAVHHEFQFAFRFAHTVMGVAFGGLHLAYGIYLHFTEQKNAS